MQQASDNKHHEPDIEDCAQGTGSKIESEVADHVDEMQYGFRKDKGTRNAILLLRMIMERAIEKQKNMYMCFIDLEKAFDTVKHGLLVDVLRRLGVDDKYIRVIARLYWKQKAAVRMGDESSEWIEIKQGDETRLRQQHHQVHG